MAAIGRGVTLSLYKRLLKAASEFPSSKRQSIINDIRKGSI
jgi:hypothetical protein